MSNCAGNILAEPRPFPSQQKGCRKLLGPLMEPHAHETSGAVRLNPLPTDLPPERELRCNLSWATASQVRFQVVSMTVNGSRGGRAPSRHPICPDTEGHSQVEVPEF